MGRGARCLALLGLAFSPQTIADDDGINSQLDDANQKKWNFILKGVGTNYAKQKATNWMHPFDQLSTSFIEDFPQCTLARE